MPEPELEQMRQSIPVARGLPLLTMLAQGHSGSVVLEFLDSLRLGIDVCGLSQA